MTIGRLVDEDPAVLIAPHGDAYHLPRAQTTLDLDAGGVIFEPACGAVSPGLLLASLGVRRAKWVRVDRAFAALLDRTPCERCWSHT